MRNHLIFLIIVLSAISCTKLDPILSSYQDIAGVWEITEIVYSKEDGQIKVDQTSTIRFSNCIEKGTLNNNDCLAYQSIDGNEYEFLYNFGFDRFSTVSDPYGEEINFKEFIGWSAVYDILKFTKKELIISSKQFYDFETELFYDKVQITLKKMN